MTKEYENRPRWIFTYKYNIQKQMKFFMSYYDKEIDKIRIIRFTSNVPHSTWQRFAVGINFERSDIRDWHVQDLPWEWVNAKDFVEKEA